MVISGKRLSEYFEFARVTLVLIPIVGLVRLALSLGGVPNATAGWFSMTAVAFAGLIVYSIRTHTRGFGSYKQLLVICTLQNLEAQAIAILAILLAIFTGEGNIFSAPEYAFGSDGKTWSHVAAHVFVGTTVGSLMAWLMGSIILAVTRKLAGSPSKIKSMA